MLCCTLNNPSSTLRRKNITPKRESLKNRPVKKKIMKYTSSPWQIYQRKNSLKKDGEEGCHGSGSESALCVAGRREREEDKTEGARAVGRLLGMWVRRGSLVIGVLGPRKRSKPRYWQAFVHLLASENEYVNWAHQTNYTCKKYMFVCFGSDSIIQRNCRRIYRYCWPWFWVVGDIAMSVVTWFIVIGDLDWDWLLARRT